RRRVGGNRDPIHSRHRSVRGSDRQCALPGAFPENGPRPFHRKTPRGSIWNGWYQAALRLDELNSGGKTSAAFSTRRHRGEVVALTLRAVPRGRFFAGLFAGVFLTVALAIATAWLLHKVGSFGLASLLLGPDNRRVDISQPSVVRQVRQL